MRGIIFNRHASQLNNNNNNNDKNILKIIILRRNVGIGLNIYV